MPRWTEAQVVKLAPDDSSVSAARRLANPAVWSDTGSTEILVWGKCQGSGKTPYQVSVDLAGPAFRCSCPSRKFPCKHALALLLLWVRGNGAVADAEQAAEFAREWADERGRRAEKRVAVEKVPDPAAQAKRLEERLALMTAGLDDFGRWLQDLVRAGTAAARQQPYGWWDETAARLVDAQLPGLAEQVRTMAGDVHRREDWADHLLAVSGRWWTATRAWTMRDALDRDAFADLRAYLGWAQPTAEVRATDTYVGTFHVLGGHRSDDGRLQQQRTWLRDAGHRRDARGPRLRRRGRAAGRAPARRHGRRGDRRPLSRYAAQAGALRGRPGARRVGWTPSPGRSRSRPRWPPDRAGWRRVRGSIACPSSSAGSRSAPATRRTSATPPATVWTWSTTSRSGCSSPSRAATRWTSSASWRRAVPAAERGRPTGLPPL